jgi:hypothetical protein
VNTEVRAKFAADPHRSTRSVAKEDGMPSASSVHRILKEAHFHPYKMQVHQVLTHQMRVRRVAHAQAQLHHIETDPGYLQCLLFSDEAHFSIHGDVNHHNFRYWDNINPHWCREKPQPTKNLKHSVN